MFGHSWPRLEPSDVILGSPTARAPLGCRLRTMPHAAPIVSKHTIFGTVDVRAAVKSVVPFKVIPHDGTLIDDAFFVALKSPGDELGGVP